MFKHVLALALLAGLVWSSAAQAEKAGKKFDPASVKGPRISYVFQPTGVIVQD